MPGAKANPFSGNKQKQKQNVTFLGGALFLTHAPELGLVANMFLFLFNPKSALTTQTNPRPPHNDAAQQLDPRALHARARARGDESLVLPRSSSWVCLFRGTPQ